MYNSIVSLTNNIIKGIKSLYSSDIKNLQYVLKKEYNIERKVSITITQEEYNDYANSKDS